MAKPFHFACDHLTPKSFQASYLLITPITALTITNGAISMTTSINERISNFLQAAMAVPFGLLALSIAAHVVPRLI